MLALARKKSPEIRFHFGNLINFELETDFDAMICLYGSIGFVKTVDNLRSSMERIAAQLRPDGLALITPWSTVLRGLGDGNIPRLPDYLIDL